MPLKTVSLFSGAGGLDLGFDRNPDFDIVACVELNAHFVETLTRNHAAGLLGSKATRVIRADIAELDPYALLEALGLQPGEVDVLIGGPPCQSFSTSGKRETVQDPRGTLIWHFARFVEALRPKVFVMENVRGLMSAALRHRQIKDRPVHGGTPLLPEEQRGSVVERWVADLTQAYRVDCFEVNAVNYGAPQLRERVLFIGNRLGRVADFPKPTHGPANNAEGLIPFATLGDALAGLHDPAPEIVDFSPRKKQFLALVPPGGNWRALPAEVAADSMGRAYHAKGGRSGWWRRLSFDLPCPTLLTLPNHSSTSLCHPTETRALSVREYARIQGFPDEWQFAGRPQDKYAQIGNAVPVRLAEVASRVAADLVSEDGGTPADAETPRFRIVYLQSHVRTRRWYADGEAVVDQPDAEHL